MSLSVDMQQTMDRYFRESTDANAFSGVVRITCRGRELFAGAYGLASRTWKVPVTMETRFDTASITKLFTTVAALQLVDAGAFSLDTQVVPYLGLTGTSISSDVTVFHCLTHSSGIGDDCEEEDGEVYADLWKTRPNYAVTETADFLPQFATKPPNFTPGERCRYCNCAFVLVGLMIEQATGLSYREYVRRNIFERAGMDASDFFNLEMCQSELAEGCDPIRNDAGEITQWKRNIYSFPPIGSPDSGAHVTAADLDRFFRAAKDGLLITLQSAEALLQPHMLGAEKDGWHMAYGLGLWFRVDPTGRVVFCQKEGYNAGVSGVLRYYPDSDLVLVILSNMAEGAWAPSGYLYDLLVAHDLAG